MSDLKLFLKNVSKEGQNSDDYSEDFENRSFISSNYTLGLPLKKLGKNLDSNLTPKLSLRYSPFDSQDVSNIDRQINITNIFSDNRLGLSQSLEGGQSLTFGFDYNVSNKNDKKLFSSGIEQILIKMTQIFQTSKMRIKV